MHVLYKNGWARFSFYKSCKTTIIITTAFVASNVSVNLKIIIFKSGWPTFWAQIASDGCCKPSCNASLYNTATVPVTISYHISDWYSSGLASSSLAIQQTLLSKATCREFIYIFNQDPDLAWRGFEVTTFWLGVKTTLQHTNTNNLHPTLGARSQGLCLAMVTYLPTVELGHMGKYLTMIMGNFTQ